MHSHHNDNDGWELYRIFVAISDCTCKTVHQLNQWLYRYNEDITVYVFVTLVNQRYLRLIVIRYLERVRITWATWDGVVHCRDIPKSLRFLQLRISVLLQTFVVTFIRNIAINTISFLNFCRDILPYREKCHDNYRKYYNKYYSFLKLLSWHSSL